MANEDAKEIAPRQAWRGLQALAGSLAPVLKPTIAKRGFAAADLLSAWGEIVGPRYARCTLPEYIRYERGGPEGGVLTVRVEGGMALYLQHELDQLTARVNAFLGRAAIRQIRLVQRPIGRPPEPRRAERRPLAAEDSLALDAALAGIEDNGLKAALRALGEGVLSQGEAGE
ncbi:MAG: DciA family protein [Bauldia sp.]